MADLSKNRDNLFSLVYDFKVNVKKGTYTREQFDKFFKNESSFIVFVDWLQEKKKNNISPFQKLTEKTTAEFYTSYVCGDTTITWAAKSKGCQGGDIPQPLVTQIDINDYVGEYTDKISKSRFSIRTDDGVNLSIYAFGQKADMTVSTTDVFKLSIPLQILTITGTITFKRDASTTKVTGFTYKLDNVPPQATAILGADFKAEGEAVKFVGTSGSLWGKNPSDWRYFSGQSSNPYGNQKDSNNPKQTDQQGNTIKVEPYNIKIPKNAHPCDENAADWEIGCSNEKIKFINKRILGRELNSTATEELRKALIDSNYIPRNTINIPSSVFDRLSRQNLNESKFGLKKFYKLVNKKL